MFNKSKQSAFSIIELLVVIVIIASLVGLAIPAIDMMQQSYNSTGSENMISAALSTARTIAMNKQRYAGIRFQKAAHITDDVLEQNQYMIFIVEDHENTGWVCAFSAVKGYKPIKLPENISVMDKIIRLERIPKDCDDNITEEPLIETDLGDSVSITDTSTFSILFSPAGKLVLRRIRCRNKNDNDDVFNTESNISAEPPTGMFIEDYENDDIGLGVETSRSSFVIYDRNKFNKINTDNDKWEYIENLTPIYINAYTGTIIEK